MSDLRPRLRGLAPLPAAVAADPARQSSVLAFEFHGFMSAVEHGSIDRGGAALMDVVHRDDAPIDRDGSKLGCACASRTAG
jgi:hypothetical protein